MSLITVVIILADHGLVPRLHPQGGKRVWGLWAIFLVWPALFARADMAALEQSSDLIGQQCYVCDSNLHT